MNGASHRPGRWPCCSMVAASASQPGREAVVGRPVPDLALPPVVDLEDGDVEPDDAVEHVGELDLGDPLVERVPARPHRQRTVARAPAEAVRQGVGVGGEHLRLRASGDEPVALAGLEPADEVVAVELDASGEAEGAEQGDRAVGIHRRADAAAAVDAARCVSRVVGEGQALGHDRGVGPASADRATASRTTTATHAGSSACGVVPVGTTTSAPRITRVSGSMTPAN